MGFLLNVLSVFKGEQREIKEENSAPQEVNLVQMRKGAKDKLFNDIDKGAEPHSLKLGFLESKVQYGEENKRIQAAFNYHKIDLEQTFSEIEIQIMKNQAFERSDLRLQYRENKGNLTRQDMGRLLELESIMAPDGGQSFNKIVKGQESRKSLQDFESAAFMNQASRDHTEINPSTERVKAATPGIKFQPR